METWAVIVAGGGGTRFGGAKQFALLAGRTVLDRSVETAREACEGVVVVLPADADWDAPPGDTVIVTGGTTRSDSVRAGLEAVPASVEIIAVHDAARPLATRRLWETVIGAVREGADAAVPGVAVADTLKRVHEGRITETVPRDELVAVQTPQVFGAAVLRAAHVDGGIETDDAALVEAAGGTVVVVPGEATNLKITQPDDLALAEAIVAARGS